MQNAPAILCAVDAAAGGTDAERSL
eukprot:COSAG06_NODE_39645_length_410_cov_0.942122_1_plen_24_part_01